MSDILTALSDRLMKELKVPSSLERIFCRSKGPLKRTSGAFQPGANHTNVCPIEDANLVSSRIAGMSLHSNLHAPTLDLDMQCALVSSSTPGHFHLYIDKVMTWENYQKLLIVMREVGILERGFVNCSIEQGQSTLRLPWVTKANEITNVK